MAGKFFAPDVSVANTQAHEPPGGADGQRARPLHSSGVPTHRLFLQEIAVMVRGSITALVCTLVFVASAAAQRPSVTTVKDVMLVMTIPGSEAVFQAASEPPTKAAQWTTLRRQAAPLIESADLMLTPKFAVDSDEWRQFAREHRTSAADAIKAIDKRDVKALENASDALYQTCENCHKRFLK
jgi:hypothetical protein